MAAFNVHEAKTHFSRLLTDVECGREVVITRAGKPVAKLIPYSPERGSRGLGTLRGQIWISPDFDDPLPEDVLESFGT